MFLSMKIVEEEEVQKKANLSVPLKFFPILRVTVQ